MPTAISILNGLETDKKAFCLEVGSHELLLVLMNSLEKVDQHGDDGHYAFSMRGKGAALW